MAEGSAEDLSRLIAPGTGYFSSSLVSPNFFFCFRILRATNSMLILVAESFISVAFERKCLADPIFSQLLRKVFLNEERINKCQLLARVQVPIVWIAYICLSISGVSFIRPQHSLAVSMLISLPCPAVGLLQSVGKYVAPSRRARPISSYRLHGRCHVAFHYHKAFGYSG